jgi:hypothetical protein
MESSVLTLHEFAMFQEKTNLLFPAPSKFSQIHFPSKEEGLGRVFSIMLFGDVIFS